MTLERRLMLTIDMILAKKKRIAIDRRQNKPVNTKAGIWGMISSVTQRPAGAESKFIHTFIVFFFNLNIRRKYLQTHRVVIFVQSRPK